MPGFTSHYLFGKKARSKMDESPLLTAVRRYPCTYNLGLQGPDIFFYHLPSVASKREVGNLAHKKHTGEFLINMASLAAYNPDPAEIECGVAYLAGFLGHYAMDMTCHPFIYARTGFTGTNDKKYFGRHCSLETDIDSAFLHRELNIRPSDFSKKNTIDISSMEAKVICGLLSDSFRETYGFAGRVSRRTAAHAIKSMQDITEKLHDAHGFRRTLARRIEEYTLGYPWLSGMIELELGYAHKDPCNLKHDTWKSPWEPDIKRNESFYDLADRALEIYLDMCSYPERILVEKRRFIAQDDVPDIIRQGHSYLSGLVT